VNHLYLVGTPIGNLEDISLRALRILKEAILIAAEDTRKTGRLLKKYGIDTPLISYFEHSRSSRLEHILGQVDCIGGPYRVLLSPFEVGFQRVGLYALSIPLVGLLEEAGRIRTYTLITAIGILAVVVLVYTWVVRRITRPLRHALRDGSRMRADRPGSAVRAACRLP